MNLPFNIFDFLMLAVLAMGLAMGRKHGLSVEIFSLARWVTVVLVCAVVYQPAGALVAKSGAFDLLSGYLIGYLAAALAVFLVFSIIERRVGPRLKGSDIFGRAEYYLGMGSGLVRFSCMLIAMLALLNARAFTPDEIKAREKFQEQNYGTSLFPGLHSLQVAIFQNSLAGSFLKQDLGFLLISPTEVNRTQPDGPIPQQTAKK